MSARRTAPRPGGLHGLPRPMPAGESILWQGSPDWRSLGRRVMHTRLVCFYGVALAAWNAIGLGSGDPVHAATGILLSFLLTAVVLGLLYGLAWLMARSTVYTLTPKRLVMRIGVALTLNLNLPLALVDHASLRLYPDGSGDIPLTMRTWPRLGYLILWPHARPWQMRQPQPMLRTIPEAARVADLLVAALAATAGPVSSQTPAAAATLTLQDRQPIEAAA